jgi:hypothetical protein
MNPHRVPALVVLLLLAITLTGSRSPARATDVDGPNDCPRVIWDMGDAPEGIPAYPSSIIGRFPTCTGIAVPVGTVDGPCPPNFAVPPAGAVVGWVANTTYVSPNFWLGCYPTPLGPEGVDSEQEAKVNNSAIGVSACSPTQTTDCVETAFFGAMSFAQDECSGDGSDAGLIGQPNLIACLTNSINFSTFNCGPSRGVYLNVLLDMNGDGDWLDSFNGCDLYGTPGCIHEWAIQNVLIPLAEGACQTFTSPTFPIGSQGGPGWLRITISENPAPPEFPWAGTQFVGAPGSEPIGALIGGETEDYPVNITAPPLPTLHRTWGQVKTLYR